MTDLPVEAKSVLGAKVRHRPLKMLAKRGRPEVARRRSKGAFDPSQTLTCLAGRNFEALSAQNLVCRHDIGNQNPKIFNTQIFGMPFANPGCSSRSGEAVSSLKDDETFSGWDEVIFPSPRTEPETDICYQYLDQTKGIDHVGHNHRLILPSGL
jgi:hypothetical protein